MNYSLVLYLNWFSLIFGCCSCWTAWDFHSSSAAALNLMTKPMIKETILFPGAKVWQILGLEVFDVETEICLFPTCLHDRLGVFFLAFTKNFKFALPASNKLSSRCSDVVPEGVGRLELWMCRPCCFVFFTHPETSSFSVVFHGEASWRLFPFPPVLPYFCSSQTCWETLLS